MKYPLGRITWIQQVYLVKMKFDFHIAKIIESNTINKNKMIIDLVVSYIN